MRSVQYRRSQALDGSKKTLIRSATDARIMRNLLASRSAPSRDIHSCLDDVPTMINPTSPATNFRWRHSHRLYRYSIAQTQTHWQRIASTMLPHSTVVPTPPSFITPNASFVHVSLLLFTGSVSNIRLLCPHTDPLTVTGARAALARSSAFIYTYPSSAATRILSQ